MTAVRRVAFNVISRQDNSSQENRHPNSYPHRVLLSIGTTTIWRCGAMTILEERGLFWWHGEPFPDTHFAPDAAVLGLLTIDDDGLATLVLDGCLPSAKGRWAALSTDPGELKGKHIEGNLSTSGKHVLMADLVRHGGRFRSNNLSQEGYRAIHCLVSFSRFPKIGADSLFHSLKIDLKGHEAWLRLGSIEILRTDKTMTATYNKNEPIVYEIDEGTLAVEYGVLGPIRGKSKDHMLDLEEKAFLVYNPKVGLTLNYLRRRFREFEDLFILLTNSDYCFLWPTISLMVDGRSLVFEWYSYRKRGSAEAPNWHECLTSFVSLRDSLGGIASAWMKKREKFGPGFYLYLGIRRDVPLYTEHRFVNLIWGLEALHRKKSIDADGSKTKARVARIVDQITDVKDKKWLRAKLKNAHEPNLAQRIFEVITSVELNFDAARLRDFANRCSDIRNELSHFGAQKDGRSYDEFIREVAVKSDALASIYHMVILHEIGIDDEIIVEWVHARSFSTRANFVEAGLLDESALRPPTPPRPNPAPNAGAAV
jgi:hypothetical protein